MVQINWTQQAKVDLKEISDYIAKDSKRYAELEVKRIRKRTEILKKFAFAGKTNKEKGDENIRELIERNYRIIYRIVHKQRIDILTVHHSSRDLSQRNIF
ncbi:MAG: type II toxin-antitoxin system RelE/ParE family toxin [Bacteroidia bacterium]|nr:type II toxin-antitoxin system RelE/ParE family toxin [Bacteroidia bacterium]